ncbi:hypothetical protein HDU76_005306, partial [Blyttiomyces sp. JEL0837]
MTPNPNPHPPEIVIPQPPQLLMSPQPEDEDLMPYLEEFSPCGPDGCEIPQSYFQYQLQQKAEILQHQLTMMQAQLDKQGQQLQGQQGQHQQQQQPHPTVRQSNHQYRQVIPHAPPSYPIPPVPANIFTNLNNNGNNNMRPGSPALTANQQQQPMIAYQYQYQGAEMYNQKSFPAGQINNNNNSVAHSTPNTGLNHHGRPHRQPITSILMSRQQAQSSTSITSGSPLPPLTRGNTTNGNDTSSTSSNS